MKCDLLAADESLAARLTESSGIQLAELEKRQKNRAEELLAIHEITKLLNCDDPLGPFRTTLPSPPGCRRNNELYVQINRRLGRTDEYVRLGQQVFRARRGGSS